MKFEDVLDVIEMLSQSQGFYGRLLTAIEELEENDEERFCSFVEEMERQNFSDAVDVVLYFEC